MAKGKDTSPQHIGPSFRGRFYQYKKGDNLVTAAWPRKRGAPRSEAQRVTQIRWRCCCWAIKALPAETQNLAREAVQYSPFLPRDILVSALYGRGPQLLMPDGTRITNLATKVNMSEVLDNIGWNQGSILYRDRNLWMELMAPDDVKFLAYDPVLKKPQWVEQGGGAGGLGIQWSFRGGGATSGSAYNSKGIRCAFALPTVLHAVMFTGAWSATDTYRVSIYRLNASNVIQEVITRETLLGQAFTTPLLLSCQLVNPIALDRGTLYAIQVEAVNQGNSFAQPVSVASGALQLVPWIYSSFLACRLAKTTPVVGDTFETPAGDQFAVALGVQVDYS